MYYNINTFLVERIDKMELKLKLNSQKLVDKEFKGKKPGYDPLEVDEFLDIVISDYVEMEKYLAEVKVDITELQKTCKVYKERLDYIEVQNEILSDKLKNIKDNDSNVNLSNIDLIKKISLLEQALYNAGIDPNTIK